MYQQSYLFFGIDFKGSIIKIKIAGNHVLVSLEVSSLFKNIPFDLVLKGIERICNTNKNYIQIVLHKFQKGIKFLMKLIFFKCDKTFYKQTYGTPISSPISGKLADIVLHDSQVEILNKLKLKKPVHCRYVDDIILTILNDKFMEVFKFLVHTIPDSTLHNNLKKTIPLVF